MRRPERAAASTALLPEPGTPAVAPAAVSPAAGGPARGSHAVVHVDLLEARHAHDAARLLAAGLHAGADRARLRWRATAA